MAITGIICEYNPLHLGHSRQISYVKTLDPEGTVVCLMSGNYVQRGQPAIFDRRCRAEAALLAGADLVLELPVNVSLSSAEGFARGGVEILSRLGADGLCFGAECGDGEKIKHTAEILLSDGFSQALRQELDRGLSFPAARSYAAEKMGADSELLSKPNNILAVEYMKALLELGSPMEPVAICRKGDYHDRQADPQNPSATALRGKLIRGETIVDYVPEPCREVFAHAEIHSMSWGERAILGKLRSMDDGEFERLAYGSEGLWRKLMHESRRQNTLVEILTAVKSKRYTRTRLDRMVMCGFLGLSREDMERKAPYVRVLAMGVKGRKVLREAADKDYFVNLGQTIPGIWQQTEDRCRRLYGLFTRETEAGTCRERVVVYF